MGEQATALYICYGTTSLNLTWIPDSVEVVVVHNDELLAEASCAHRRVRHLYPGTNIGFGAGVNLALPQVEGSRLIIVNPDTALRREHWDGLAGGAPEEIVVVPLVDASERPTSLINRYPTATVALLTGFRAGRLLPRGSRRRVLASLLIGRWGTDHSSLVTATTGRWDLRTYWASAAVLSVATDRIRSIDGFDPAYFLYMEDVDLCRRLGEAYPLMQIRMASAPAGIHAVGGSIVASDAGARNLSYLSSILTYVSRQRGLGWRLVGIALSGRGHWLRARQSSASIDQGADSLESTRR
jgi:GT2 family glycosyltransferase